MKYDLLSLGSSVVDKIVCVDEDFIKAKNLDKGGTRNWLNRSHDELLAEIAPKNILSVPGGSAANATKIVAGLGMRCAYLSKIGNDSWGQFYKKSCVERGIDPLFSQSEDLPTGTMLSLVSPDGERTICADLRACQSIKRSDIDIAAFSQTKLFHLDGYNFFYEDAFNAAIEAAQKNQCIISLDCCSYELIRSHLKMFTQLLESRTLTLLFCNEREAFELTGRSDPKEACKKLSPYSKYVTVMVGERGSHCSFEEKLYYQETNPIKPLDTTGAGDMYVGGFLYGFLNNLSVQECMLYGTKAAAEGIQIFGGEIPLKHLKQLKKQFANLELAHC